MFENTQLKNPDFSLPPTELIKSENIPKVNSLCQKVPLLFWVSYESCAAWAARWGPAWLVLFLGCRGARIPQRSEHPAAEQSWSLPPQWPWVLAVVHWGNGFELVCVLISCAWETPIPP